MRPFIASGGGDATPWEIRFERSPDLNGSAAQFLPEAWLRRPSLLSGSGEAQVRGRSEDRKAVHQRGADQDFSGLAGQVSGGGALVKSLLTAHPERPTVKVRRREGHRDNAHHDDKCHR